MCGGTKPFCLLCPAPDKAAQSGSSNLTALFHMQEQDLMSEGDAKCLPGAVPHSCSGVSSVPASSEQHIWCFKWGLCYAVCRAAVSRFVTVQYQKASHHLLFGFNLSPDLFSLPWVVLSLSLECAWHLVRRQGNPHPLQHVALPGNMQPALVLSPPPALSHRVPHISWPACGFDKDAKI